MPLYVVSFDLRRRKDYQALWDEMRRLVGHKPLKSVYFLNVDATMASALRDHLARFIDDDDQLIVVEFHKKPAHQKANHGNNRWIEDNI